MTVVDDIKARLDIVETVSTYVDLQRSGRYFKAPCPFHTEKTPSFIVNPERQSWRCFGACATGGDVFSFVMRREGLDFGGTLRLMAQKTGIALSNNRGETDRSDALFRVNQAAAEFYAGELDSLRGRRAMRYLDERGVSAEARSSFALGLSPDSWGGLKSHLLGLGFDERQAVDAGVLRRGEDGNTRDFFRGRLMFPIHDRQGRIAGFGARALDDSMPKYLNTSATPIFDKRNILYGLHLADKTIRAQNTGIVVEGYMDAIAAHQYGYANVVASMGTALTDQQVSQLKSLATTCVLALDPDAAGQEAMQRNLDSTWRALQHQAAGERRGSVGPMYFREPFNLKVAQLPPGRDPDELIRQDASEWERLTREASPFMDFYIPAVTRKLDLGTPQGKAQAAQILAPMVTSGDPIEQDHYIRVLAEHLQVSEEALKASIGGQRRRNTAAGRVASRRERPPEVDASPFASEPGDPVEDYTLSLLLRRPELKKRVSAAAVEYFHRSEGREVFTQWLGCSTMDDLRDALDESLHEHLAYLSQRDLVASDPHEHEAALSQCLQRLERRHLQELQRGMLASEDAASPPPREIEGDVARVNARLRELFS